MADQNNQGGAALGSGLTLIIMKDDKLSEIMEKSRDLLEVQFRHTLELAKAGIGARLAPGDGCCNCVAC
jgi:hypothetical protein